MKAKVVKSSKKISLTVISSKCTKKESRVKMTLRYQFPWNQATLIKVAAKVPRLKRVPNRKKVKPAKDLRNLKPRWSAKNKKNAAKKSWHNSLRRSKLKSATLTTQTMTILTERKKNKPLRYRLRRKRIREKRQTHTITLWKRQARKFLSPKKSVYPRNRNINKKRWISRSSHSQLDLG